MRELSSLQISFIGKVVQSSPVQSSPVQYRLHGAVSVGPDFPPSSTRSDFTKCDKILSISPTHFYAFLLQWELSPGHLAAISWRSGNYLSLSPAPHQNRLSINGDISDTIYFTMKISIHYLRSTVLRFGKYEPTMCIQCLVCREERERERGREREGE